VLKNVHIDKADGIKVVLENQGFYVKGINKKLGCFQTRIETIETKRSHGKAFSGQER
jgi:hypothetical protein